MSKSTRKGNSQEKTLKERKAALESRLEDEPRTSRRQELLKKIWKLDQQQSKTAKEKETVLNG